MGDRYFIELTCPECGEFDDMVYYAPTSDFTTWSCACGAEIDLEEETSISAKEASNRAEIERAIGEL